eukprot:5690010-Pleurochrysis_carterae.AAC.1
MGRLSRAAVFVDEHDDTRHLVAPVEVHVRLLDASALEYVMHDAQHVVLDVVVNASGGREEVGQKFNAELVKWSLEAHRAVRVLECSRP